MSLLQLFTGSANQNVVHFQVAPSFFDAPGAQAAGKVTPRQKVGGLTIPASFSSQYNPLNTSTAALQRFPQDLPDVTFAFVSEAGYKVSTHYTVQSWCQGYLPPGRQNLEAA